MSMEMWNERVKAYYDLYEWVGQFGSTPRRKKNLVQLRKSALSLAPI